MADEDQNLTTADDAVCEECGSYGALETGDRKLCPNCITLAGSACAGSEDNDGG